MLFLAVAPAVTVKSVLWPKWIFDRRALDRGPRRISIAGRSLPGSSFGILPSSRIFGLSRPVLLVMTGRWRVIVVRRLGCWSPQHRCGSAPTCPAGILPQCTPQQQWLMTKLPGPPAAMVSLASNAVRLVGCGWDAVAYFRRLAIAGPDYSRRAIRSLCARSRPRLDQLTTWWCSAWWLRRRRRARLTTRSPADHRLALAVYAAGDDAVHSRRAHPDCDAGAAGVPG